MLEKIKKSLRITTDSLDEEVEDLIEAAKLDLNISGVEKIEDDDKLIIRAVTLYCKAQFGYDNPEADRFQQTYDSLKTHLSMSSDYKADDSDET